MALTLAEQREMEALERELAPKKAKPAGLTPEEQAEMAALESELAPAAASAPAEPQRGFMDRLLNLRSSLKGDIEAQGAKDASRVAVERDKRRGQAEIEQFANAATMGYLPQIQAAASKPIYGALNLVTGNDVKPDEYVNERDANINRLDQQSQEFPFTAAKAGLAGIGANTLVLPTMAPAKGLIGAGLKTAATGAAYGAAANPGDVEGEVNPIQFGERLDNAETGALIGGGVGLGAGLGSKAAGFFSKAPKTTKRVAEEAAFKSSGAMLKDFRNAAAKDDVERVGRFMLDEKLVKAGDNVERIAEKAAQINKKAGSELDSVYKQAASALRDPKVYEGMPGFNPIRDKNEVLKMASEKLGDSVDGKRALRQLGAYLDDIGKKYGDQPLPPRVANDIKGAFDEAINYARNPLNKQPGVEKAYSSARQWLAKRIDQSIDYIGKASGKPDLAKRLKDANMRYGTSKTVYRIASDRVQREAANQAMGLTEKIAGGAGATVGGIAAMAGGSSDPIDIGIKSLGMGLLAAGANKASKIYGPGLLATGANKLQPMMNVVGAGGSAAQGLLSNPELLSRAAIQGSRPRRRKRGLLDENRNIEIPITEGYEQ